MLKNRKGFRAAVALCSSAAVVGGGIFMGAAPAMALNSTSKLVTVTGLSVAKGPTTGGTVVLITGKGFTRTGVAATTVNFNGTPAASIAVVSDTQMTATTAAATGSGYVVVDDTTNSSDPTGKAAKWSYVAPLTLTALTTGTKLNPLGGTVLTFAVSSGLGASQTAFDAAKITATVAGTAAKVKWTSDTAGTIAVPAGAVDSTALTPVKICVLSNGVYDPTTSCDAVGATYATVISKLSVTSSVLAGNASATAITITGKGFTGVNLTSGVNFGTNAATCTRVTATTDTKLTCTIPAATVTTAGSVVQVIITPAFAPFGTTAASAFTYTDV